MSTPTVPGVDRDVLAAVIRKAFAYDTSGSLSGRAADAALAHIAAHHECSTLPATYPDPCAAYSGPRAIHPTQPGGPMNPDEQTIQERHDEYVARRTAELFELAGLADARATRQQPRACTCGAKYDRCPDCTADDAYEKGRRDAACDREHDDADEWVEVNANTWCDLPNGTRRRREWVQGAPGDHLFVHRDDLPGDPVDERVKVMARALAEHVGSGDPDDAEMWLDDAEDVLAALLDEHGWTVTRKGAR